MENYKVSIIIPIYKVEKYLPECLDSCINQTYKNIEIIAVNDGSPDNCGDIIDNYAAKDSRIVHIKKQNEGLPEARETGINASTGAYIIHVDGDDFIALNAVEIFMDTIYSENADMVFCDFIYYYENKKNTIYETTLHDGFIIKTPNDYLNNTTRMEMWGRIIKRELCLGCERQKMNVGEDIFTMVQIIMKCSKIVYKKTPLFYYRQNETSLMHKPETVKNDIIHKLLLTNFIIKKQYPSQIMHQIIMSNVVVISKYCNDYDNLITASMKNDVKQLTTLSLKYYPTMIIEKLFTKRIKGVVIFYIIHYFPNMVKIVYKYNKIRGKKNYEL